MTLRNSDHSWGGIAKVLHWLIAAMILGMFVLGWIAVNYPMSPTKIKLFTWHKSFGITILMLALLRMAWRFLDPPPASSAHAPVWERQLARTSHALLYLAMIAMPVSGWIINSAANFPLKLFGLIRLPDIVPADKTLQTQAEFVHLSLFWILVALLILHVGAALWHHIVRRDDILTRMLPGTTRGAKEPVE